MATMAGREGSPARGGAAGSQATRVRNDPNAQLLAECRKRCKWKDHYNILGVSILICCDGEELAGRIRPFLSTFWQALPPAAGSIAFYVRGDEQGGYRVVTSQGRSVESPSWRPVFSYLFSLLHAHLWDARRDVLPLHSAAVEREGVGLLLPAASGRGKTTLALELAARGYRYLSDEFAPICLATGQVLPYPRPLQVSAEAARRLLGSAANLALAAPPFLDDGGEERYLLDPQGLLTCGGVAAVRAIVFLEAEFSEEGRLCPLSKAQALERLASCALVYHREADWKRQAVAALTSLVREAHCSLIRLGPIGTNAEIVDGLLRGDPLGGSSVPAGELDDLAHLSARIMELLGRSGGTPGKGAA